MAKASIITQLIEYLDISTSSFERKIDVGASAISKAISRNSELKLDTIEKISRAFPQVNRTWLMTGEGEMISEDYTSRSKSDYCGIDGDGFYLRDEKGVVSITHKELSDLGYRIAINIVEANWPNVRYFTNELIRQKLLHSLLMLITGGEQTKKISRENMREVLHLATTTGLESIILHGNRPETLYGIASELQVDIQLVEKNTFAQIYAHYGHTIQHINGVDYKMKLYWLQDFIEYYKWRPDGPPKGTLTINRATGETSFIPLDPEDQTPAD